MHSANVSVKDYCHKFIF